MKIAVICTSDTIGGAAISTTRLTNALSKHGADAQLIVLKKGSKIFEWKKPEATSKKSWHFTQND